MQGMKGVILLTIFALVAACRAIGGDAISWRPHNLEYISSRAPYYASFKFASRGDRVIVVEILDANGEAVGVSSQQVANSQGQKKFATVRVDFAGPLTVGNEYDLALAMYNDDKLVATAHTTVECKSDDVSFAGLPAISADKPTDTIDIVYSATERRNVFVAVRNAADSKFLGGGRLNVQAGRNLAQSVTVNYKSVEGPPRDGQVLIVRLEIRPVGSVGTEARLDRVEQTVIAHRSGGGPTPTPTGTPGPSASPAPYSIAFKNPDIQALPDCQKIKVSVEIYVEETPVLITVAIRDSDNTWITAGRRTALQKGVSTFNIDIPINGLLEPGEVYRLEADLRPDSDPTYQNVLVAAETGLIPAVQCNL